MKDLIKTVILISSGWYGIKTSSPVVFPKIL
jgi:hypothetical protein